MTRRELRTNESTWRAGAPHADTGDRRRHDDLDPMKLARVLLVLTVALAVLVAIV